MRAIVKVQRPLMNSEPVVGSDILIYDQDRVHLERVDKADLPVWLIDALANNPKVFAQAMWTPQNGWRMVGLAGWQPW